MRWKKQLQIQKISREALNSPGNKPEERDDFFVNVKSLAQCFTCELNNVIYHYCCY